MNRPTILIVDDEPDLREAIAFDFRRKNFQVLTAASGNEAFKVVEAGGVDVVLSDVCMPDGGGIELLDRIKARDVFEPVVMLITGFADITVEEAYDKGADAVFPKPFDRKLLMEAVQKVVLPLERRYMRRSSRIALNVTGELRVVGQGAPLKAKIVNIGRGGLFAELGNSFPGIEAKVDFQFEAATSGLPVKMNGRGIVRWVRQEGAPDKPAGCGIEFLELDAESSKRVIEFINFSKTRSYIPMK